MRYLIIQKNETPFFTNWYDYDNNYVPGMMVVCYSTGKYTTDGKTWLDVEEDCL